MLLSVSNRNVASSGRPKNLLTKRRRLIQCVLCDCGSTLHQGCHTDGTWNTVTPLESEDLTLRGDHSVRYRGTLLALPTEKKCGPWGVSDVPHQSPIDGQGWVYLSPSAPRPWSSSDTLTAYSWRTDTLGWMVTFFYFEKRTILGKKRLYL